MSCTRHIYTVLTLYVFIPNVLTGAPLKFKFGSRKKKKDTFFHQQQVKESHTVFFPMTGCASVRVRRVIPCEYEIILVFDGRRPGQAGQDLEHYAG